MLSTCVLFGRFAQHVSRHEGKGETLEMVTSGEPVVEGVYDN